MPLDLYKCCLKNSCELVAVLQIRSNDSDIKKTSETGKVCVYVDSKIEAEINPSLLLVKLKRSE